MEGRQYDLHEADAMLRESGINAAPIVAMVEKALNGFYSSVGKDIYEIGSHIRSCAPAFSFSKIKDAARIVSESYAYINDHKEAWDCLNNDQLLSDFVSRLKWSRVESLLPGQEPAWGDIQSRCALLTSNITIFDFFQLYESIGPPAKPYRTAERSAIRTDYPKEMAVITDKRYQFALSFHRSDRAYLLLLRSLSGIPYRGKEGLLFEKNELQNRLANDGIANIDIALLCSVYSLLLAKYKKECMDEKNALTDTVDLYIPQFMEYTGLARNHSKQGVESMFTAIKQFKNVIGCLQMVEKAGPDYREVEVMRYYPALILTKYSKDHNTISLTSPYLARLVSIVFSENIKRKKNGDLILTKDERIQFDASHSFLIKSSMAKQKNRAAVENVSIIVSLIEQAGGPKRGKRTISPSITVSELISRNESLKMMLDSASSNSYKTKILRRCFEKTYELLKEETWLLEKYSRLKIPNDIPTVRTMNTLTLKFPHCGRKDEL